MMEGAFFVPKGEILDWINKTFNLSVAKIEQLGTGAVYCQILDSIHTGKVNMSRVNFKAKLEWEFVNNFKILQQSFLKCNLNKHIEVERLVKAKYQDNLEFAQWMKRYWDLNGGAGKDYDPMARRSGVEGDFNFGGEKPVKGGAIQKTEPSKQSSGEKAAVQLKAKPKERERPVDKDIRSYSPSMRNLPKDGKPLKDRFSNFKTEKEVDSELKSLQRFLQEIKVMSMNQDHQEPADKLKRILDLTHQALSNKLFVKEGAKDKSKNPIEKINEDEGLEDSKSNN